MAILYAAVDGTILGQFPDVVAGPPPAPPVGTVHALTFDGAANLELLDALLQERARYRLAAPPAGAPAGTLPILQRDGAPVMPAPPGPVALARANQAMLSERASAQLAALRTLATQLDTASKTTGMLTAAQLSTQLRQTQAGLAAVTLATLRTIRLAANQLDDTD